MQLSRTVPNNGDSHKSSMYQNVQTCVLEVNSTTTVILNYQLTLCKVFTAIRNPLDFRHAS